MENLKKEKKIVEGKESKNETYSSKNQYSDEQKATEAYQRAAEKLFNVNRWTRLPGISSTFQLYNRRGEGKDTVKVQVNDYIKIELPGPFPENWVVVTDIKEEENLAEFTVSPSSNPTDKGEGQEEVDHFFIDEATSTFRVKKVDNTIFGYEVGKNEGINNQGKEAGERKLVNTLIAEGGWAGFQKFQWEKLTDYFVHKVEIEK
ncbi:hypothetical protein JKA74_03320 [Marivirga sp. S37H4]|uniref:Uncharacterized protein n=1 Tax=Marivirga aurantiaca TaxID=2802615 RepID=A0A935C5U0_9BACT|nr:hypothetical protein [Marivirga aurantiaca]MBK6264056.1 hypothetical protein [Marivirga aurantiaca]